MINRENSDRTIYILKDSKMVKVGTTDRPDRNNFLIICELGDWSGFRPLASCEKQIPELESYGRPDGYYQIVERY